MPRGYKEHLLALEQTLGSKELGFDQAPYFGPTMYYPEEAIELWEGNRGMQEYAREAFLEEERLNGLTWMDDDGDEADDTAEADDEGGTASSTGQSIQCPSLTALEHAKLTGGKVSDHKPADAETL